MPQLMETNGVRDSLLKLEAVKRASADPLPGPVGDAFTHGAIQVGSYSVRRVVASDWKVLKALDSPIIKMLLELRQNPANPAEVTYEADEEWEMAYQFTHTPSECRELISKGREAFRAAAQEAIGDKEDSHVVAALVLGVVEQIKRSVMTAVAYRQELEEKGEITFFPGAEANPKMASAG